MPTLDERLPPFRAAAGLSRVELVGVRKSFGDKTVVRDLTLAAEEGELLVLVDRPAAASLRRCA